MTNNERAALNYAAAVLCKIPVNNQCTEPFPVINYAWAGNYFLIYHSAVNPFVIWNPCEDEGQRQYILDAVAHHGKGYDFIKKMGASILNKGGWLLYPDEMWQLFNATPEQILRAALAACEIDIPKWPLKEFE